MVGVERRADPGPPLFLPLSRPTARSHVLRRSSALMKLPDLALNVPTASRASAHSLAAVVAVHSTCPSPAVACATMKDLTRSTAPSYR